jgi:hypothetical protein
MSDPVIAEYGPNVNRAGSATERCGSHPSADDRMVSQSRADLCGLFGLGASASLACLVFRALRCGASVRAMSSGGV